MKRFFCILLAALVLFSLSACKTAMSDSEAEKDITGALGNFKDLMNMDEIINKLPSDALIENANSQPPSSPEGSNPDSSVPDVEVPEGEGNVIVIGNGVVVYKTVYLYDEVTDGGIAYNAKTTVIHFGNAREIGENKYSLHFIGANVLFEVTAEDLAALRQELSADLDTGEFTAEEIESLRKMLGGEKIYVAANSNLWELYADVDVDIETTWNEEIQSFLVKIDYGYDEWYNQYSYEIVGFNGKTKEYVYYQIDDDGKEWLQAKNTYSYLPDGTIQIHSIDYYSFTTQPWSEGIRVGKNDFEMKSLWNKGWTEDGILEYENYYDENDNYVYIAYNTLLKDGSILRKSIYDKNYDNGNMSDSLIYEEEYWEDIGLLREKFEKNGNICTNSHYFEDGTLESSATYDTSRLDYEGNYLTIQRIETASATRDKFVTEYDENGKETQRTRYDKDGLLLSITYFGEGGIEITIEYDENGNPIT